MPISSGKISIYHSGTDTTVEIPVPEYPYRCRVMMPIRNAETGDGVIGTFDPGVAYDLRQCEASIFCTSAEAAALLALIRTTTRDTVNPAYTITMNTSSGFYPFGPDKGDVGPFACSIEVLRDNGIGQAPYLYHNIDLLITKSTATYPAYTLPTQVPDGGLTIGNVSALRCPPEWFKPSQRIAIDVAYRWGGLWTETSGGASADRYETSATMVCNQSKAAALINDITTTLRGGQFDIVTQANSYPFGSDLSDDGTFAVRLRSYVLDCVNARHNQWEFSLDMVKAA